jgi:hypothetical protein
MHFVSFNHIGGAMVYMLALRAVYRGFEPWLGQTNDYKMGIYYLSLRTQL